ncbi:MAG: phenylacetic acid degradation bifunctional protein PaaZ [Epibacterium sp.]
MVETINAKTKTQAQRDSAGLEMAHAIQSGVPDSSAENAPPCARTPLDVALRDTSFGSRHGTLAQQIAQCREAGAQVLRAQSFAKRAQLLRQMQAGLAALAQSSRAPEDAILSDPGFAQGLVRMKQLVAMATRSLPDQKMILRDTLRPCAPCDPAAAPGPDRQVRMRLKQPGNGLAAHVVANQASFSNLLERLSLAILSGRSALLCVSPTAQPAALGLCRLLRSTGALPESVLHVVPVIEAEVLLPHLQRGDVITLCAAPSHTATFHAHPKVLEGSLRLGSCQASHAALLLAPEFNPAPADWDLFLDAVAAVHETASFATCVLVPASLEERAQDRLRAVYGAVSRGAEALCSAPETPAPHAPRITLVAYRDTQSVLEVLRRFPGQRSLTVLSRQHGFLGDFVASLAPCLDQINVFSPETARAAAASSSSAVANPIAAPVEDNILALLEFYLEESEITGPATLLTQVSGIWVEGVPVREGEHPFRKPLSRLKVGDHLRSADRIVRAEDVEAFGHLTGDLFYAHMDEAAARNHPFFDGRVAHGQYIMALANGLFVDPEPGPVLANLGARDLRFFAPVYFDTALYVTLTCCCIGPLNRAGAAEVQWSCQVRRSDDDTRVAQFDLLTLVAAQWPPQPAPRAQEA